MLVDVKHVNPLNSSTSKDHVFGVLDNLGQMLTILGCRKAATGLTYCKTFNHVGLKSCGFKCWYSWCSSLCPTMHDNSHRGFFRFFRLFSTIQLCIGRGWVGELFSHIWRFCLLSLWIQIDPDTCSEWTEPPIHHAPAAPVIHPHKVMAGSIGYVGIETVNLEFYGFEIYENRLSLFNLPLFIIMFLTSKCAISRGDAAFSEPYQDPFHLCSSIGILSSSRTSLLLCCPQLCHD